MLIGPSDQFKVWLPSCFWKTAMVYKPLGVQHENEFSSFPTDPVTCIFRNLESHSKFSKQNLQNQRSVPM